MKAACRIQAGWRRMPYPLIIRGARTSWRLLEPAKMGMTSSAPGSYGLGHLFCMGRRTLYDVECHETGSQRRFVVLPDMPTGGHLLEGRHEDSVSGCATSAAVPSHTGTESTMRTLVWMPGRYQRRRRVYRAAAPVRAGGLRLLNSRRRPEKAVCETLHSGVSYLPVDQIPAGCRHS